MERLGGQLGLDHAHFAKGCLDAKVHDGWPFEGHLSHDGSKEDAGQRNAVEEQEVLHDLLEIANMMLLLVLIRIREIPCFQHVAAENKFFQEGERQRLVQSLEVETECRECFLCGGTCNAVHRQHPMNRTTRGTQVSDARSWTPQVSVGAVRVLGKKILAAVVDGTSSPLQRPCTRQAQDRPVGSNRTRRTSRHCSSTFPAGAGRIPPWPLSHSRICVCPAHPYDVATPRLGPGSQHQTIYKHKRQNGVPATITAKTAARVQGLWRQPGNDNGASEPRRHGVM